MSKLKIAWYNEATSEYFTPKVRLVYPALLEPKINKKYPNNPPKFSATALVPKGADIAVITAAVTKIAQDLYGAKWKEADPAVKMPIKKTENYEKLAEYAEEYPYMLRVSANAEYPPALFGPDKKSIDASSGAKEVYGGRWAIMALNVWGPTPENKNVNRFVSFGVQRVQLLDHDDQIATGRINTADGFDAIEGIDGGNGSSDDLF